MLIRFNVKNFLSFGTDADEKPVEFAMTAGKTRQKKSHIFDDGNIKLLKLAAVYGANASGKSNLVRAMQFMKDAVTKGKLPDGFFGKYCKSDTANKERESYFEVEIRLSEKYYAYGFEAVLSRGEFVSEWLVELPPDGEEKTIFSRDTREGTYDLSAWKSNKKLFTRLDIYASDIQNDASALFLSVMNQNRGKLYHDYPDADIFRKVYGWMGTRFNVFNPNEPMPCQYLTETGSLKEAEAFLSAYGTGIDKIRMVEVPPEYVEKFVPKPVMEAILPTLESAEKKIQTRKVSTVNALLRGQDSLFMIMIDKDGHHFKDIQFSHGNSDIPFELSEESDGTVRLLDLFEILISGEGKTFVIDELDRCLHPSLTYQFIRDYLEVAARRNVQLIVTTHESRLMDFDLLRRDEIWFAEKNQRGETQVYSLEEFNTRYDRKIDKAYLEGQYGGVPVFNTLFPMEAPPHEDAEAALCEDMEDAPHED